MKLPWVALLAAAIAYLIAAAACQVDVPLGVDPQSDAAQSDAAVDGE